MRKGWLLGSIGTAVAVYFIGSPYLTVHQMRSAAQNRDGEALSEYIEFPSVRQSLKDQINAAFAKEMSKKDMKHNSLAAVDAAFASVLVDKIVEAYVNPAAITQMMAGERPKKNDGGPSASAPTSDKSTAHRPFSDVSMSYESLNKFVVTVTGDPKEQAVRFILRRRGIGWKLTDIVLSQPPHGALN
jgi:hypothetical protein